MNPEDRMRMMSDVGRMYELRERLAAALDDDAFDQGGGVDFDVGGKIFHYSYAELKRTAKIILELTDAIDKGDARKALVGLNAFIDLEPE